MPRIANYRFIIDRYKRLASGEISMSDYNREIHLARQPEVCALCGESGANGSVELIPRRLGGPVGLQNQVYACSGCAGSKGDRGLLEWWCDVLGPDKDELPRVPAGLFLKMAYVRHAAGFTLRSAGKTIRDLWPEERK